MGSIGIYFLQKGRSECLESLKLLQLEEPQVEQSTELWADASGLVPPPTRIGTPGMCQPPEPKKSVHI